MTLSIGERLLLHELKRRVEALELAQVPRCQLEQQNLHRRAGGERLRSAIRKILAEHPRPTDLSAKHVLRALQSTDIGRAQLPSVRTVQWHIHAIRNEPALRAK